MARAYKGVRHQTGAQRVGRGARRRGAAANATRTGSTGSTGISAQFPGRCSACDRPYPKGARITKFGEEWLHVACAAAKKATQQVLDGDTFRSQRRSDWRLGGSPSSPRTRR